MFFGEYYKCNEIGFSVVVSFFFISGCFVIDFELCGVEFEWII